MARQWRIEYSGALYHVLSRGNEQRDIFLDDEDRKCFIDILEDLSKRFNIKVCAYVLMSNHYHLLLKTEEANLSKSMQWLGTTFTRRFNIRHLRSGHLFQGRFKSILVENDEYLMNLSCYIHRNPLRAKLVNRLADHRWSSYPSYAYNRVEPKWLYKKLVFSRIPGKNKNEKNEKYRKNVQRYSGEEGRIFENLKHGLLLGSEKFISEIKDKYLTDNVNCELPQQKGMKKDINVEQLLIDASKILKCDLEQLRKKSRVTKQDKEKRNVLLYFLWESGYFTNKEIGSQFNITYSSVSKQIQSVNKEFNTNKSLKKQLNRINSLFKI